MQVRSRFPRPPAPACAMAGRPGAVVAAVLLAAAAVLLPAGPVEAAPAGDAIAGGGRHSCALKPDGRVWCWGANVMGQLGDGSTTRKYHPVRAVLGTTVAVALELGFNHSCAIAAGGDVYCWGYNDHGQVGIGSDGEDVLRPARVAGLDGRAVAIAAGSNHSCAALADGRVRCWGINTFGQLGDGTKERRNAPVDVVGLGGAAVAVAAGSGHSCALLASGRVRCWGYNFHGQLGDGSQDSSPVPVSVTQLRGATAIGAGYNFSCALLGSGRVKCWGANGFGQLGNGGIVPSDVPLPVRRVAGATALQLGAYHACALVAPGLRCWGYNRSGQIGDGSDDTTVTPPVRVRRLAGSTIALATGDFHSCALRDDGRIRCWGANEEGQIGDGSLDDRRLPAVPVRGRGYGPPPG